MSDKEQRGHTEAVDRALGTIPRRLGLETLDETNYFPRFVQVETTRLCNANCPFCPADIWDKSTPFMSDTLFDKIVEEIKDYAHWIRWVNMQKAGEPLLDKKIFSRIAKMKDAGVGTVTMASNCSALTDKNARALINSGLDELMISIDSVEKETYEKMRVGLNYERVIANITNFFKVRKEMNSKMTVRVRAVALFDEGDPRFMKEWDQWSAFWEKYREPHDRIYMKRAHNWGNTKELEGQIPVFQEVFHPCIIPWSSINIASDGTVALCTQDYDAVANLGNINHQSITEVWRGKKFEDVRKLHSTGCRNEIGFCKGCTVYDEEFSLETEKFETFPMKETA